MSHLPVFLDLAGRRCIVIGAGSTALPRIRDLLAAQADVAVVAPTAAPEVGSLADQRRLRYLPRPYATGDLDGCLLAYAATGDDALHAHIAADARAAGVLLNVVDRPAWCDFITPAVVRRGRLRIAISTGGASPALAQRIRQDLEASFGPEYAFALELLARLRPTPAVQNMSFGERQRILGALVASPLLDHIRAGDEGAIDSLLAGADPSLSLAAVGLDGFAGGDAQASFAEPPHE